MKHMKKTIALLLAVLSLFLLSGCQESMGIPADRDMYSEISGTRIPK